MVFVDDLAYELFVLGFVAVLTLYMTLSVYFTFKRSKKADMYDVIDGAVLPLGLLGIYLFIMAVAGQLSWPLPGAFNMVYFDPMVSLAMVLIGFAYSIRARLKMHYIGFFSLLVGIMTIYYGVIAYSLKLSLSPLGLFGLFFSFGAVAVLAFPVSLILDLKPGLTSEYPKVWVALLVLFWIALLVAALVAFFTGFSAVPAHFSNPP
jgi:putative membrane protein